MRFRRRREGKTNYYRRRVMVLSGKTRLVVRRTNRYIVAQIVKFHPIGDVTVVGLTSKVLNKFGWLGDENNTPAAYLLGLVLGYRARLRGVSEAVIDVGLHKPTPGARVFAVLKGAVDAGLEVPYGEEVVPDESRIRGEHIASYARMLKERDPERYRRVFSRYLARGLEPERLPEHFDEVRQRIVQHYEELLRKAEAIA